MKKMMIAALLAAGVAACSGSHDAGKPGHDAHAGHAMHHEIHWGYEGAGAAEHWGDLKPEFAACKNGKSQSPVNITNTVKGELPALSTSYQPTDLAVLNNGHTIQVPYDNGSTLTLGDKQYKLVQFHFHAGSENAVNGQKYAMELHFVHKNAEGKLAVLGVMIKEGDANPALAKIVDNMPTEGGKTNTTALKIDANNLLPKERNYYHFMGSLTTPPCTEGVSWNVLQTPITASKAQLDKYRALYPMNARPVQPLNTRTILAN